MKLKKRPIFPRTNSLELNKTSHNLTFRTGSSLGVVSNSRWPSRRRSASFRKSRSPIASRSPDRRSGGIRELREPLAGPQFEPGRRHEHILPALVEVLPRASPTMLLFSLRRANVLFAICALFLFNPLWSYAQGGCPHFAFPDKGKSRKISRAETRAWKSRRGMSLRLLLFN